MKHESQVNKTEDWGLVADVLGTAIVAVIVAVLFWLADGAF